MYSVKVRDSVMIAHSLNDPAFGPAQRLHGATFVVDVTFMSDELDEHNVVIDIAHARTVVGGVLDELRYRNLDELEVFQRQLTTAEYIAKHIHDRIREALDKEFSGTLQVTLRETHDAWASYTGPATSQGGE